MMKRRQLSASVLLLVAATSCYVTLFASPALPPPPPASCGALAGAPPAVRRRAVFGVGVFATRRRYQRSLDELERCVAERTPSDDTCALAVASSRWRAFAREEARASANWLARRFSHFLDCGWRGAFTDCDTKGVDFYFRRYAPDYDCGDDLYACEPLCAHLLARSAASRRAVDDLLSPARAAGARVVLAAAALAALAGVRGSRADGSKRRS